MQALNMLIVNDVILFLFLTTLLILALYTYPRFDI